MAVRDLYDIHCHLVPYVDDGAFTMEEAMELLEMQYEQNVRTIIVTPHARTRMFESPEDKVESRFLKLKKAAEEDPALKELRLYLGREYYCDKRFLELLDTGEFIRTMGPTKFVLIEFSTQSTMTAEYMEKAVERMIHRELIPVIAHVERYVPVQEDLEILRILRESGAWIQVNSASILGKEGWRSKRLAFKILKAGFVDLVASDAHHVEFREPNLGDCARYIEKKLGASEAERLLRTNPAKLLGTDNDKGDSSV